MIRRLLSALWPQKPQIVPRVVVPAPAFDLVTCPTCEQPFYRSRAVHPDLACIDCQMKQWDVWIQNYKARQALNGSLIRRLS